MSLDETIESGRLLAEVILIDDGTISRPTADSFDEETGVLTEGVPTLIYSGPCRIRMPTAIETNVIFGETLVTKMRFVALFRWDIPHVQIGDEVHIATSDDPHIETRTFRVEVVPSLSVITHRKFGVEVAEE